MSAIQPPASIQICEGAARMSDEATKPNDPKAFEVWASQPIKTLALRWLLVQRIDTVLLLMILLMLWQFGNYVINTAIPAHLQQIQAGYERVTGEHHREVERLESTFREILNVERKRAGLPPIGDTTRIALGSFDQIGAK